MGFGIKQILGLIVLLCPFVAGSDDWKPPRYQRKIACIGDSLTDSAYPVLLQEMCKDRCKVKVWAQKGARISTIAYLLNSALESDFKPTHVVIYGGINDCLVSRPKSEEARAMIDLFREKAIQNGAISIFITHHGWAKRSRVGNQCSVEFNKGIRSSHASRIIDTEGLSVKGVLKAEYDSGDGLHLNRKGYRELARRVFGEIFWDTSSKVHTD